MNVLVLGAGGMAGHVVSLYLRSRGLKIDTLSAKNSLDPSTHLIDVTDKVKLESFLGSKQYDVVINCIAMLVKQSDERKDLATYLNSYLPHFLENYYRNLKTRIIHLSSDGVFSNKTSPYKEDSAYDGKGFYDRSKALGELINPKDLTLRTSIVGPDMREIGSGLFNWFYGQKGEISGYDKVLWRGVTTTELAKGIEQAISQGLTGVYHFVPNTSISKFDLLGLFRTVFDRQDITIKPNSGVRFSRKLINTRDDFDFTISDYKTMVEEMRSWIEDHEYLYPHYCKNN